MNFKIGSKEDVEHWLGEQSKITSGSDISYGEAVSRQWEELLKENPSKRNIRILKDQIKGLGIRIEMLTGEHEADIKDPYTGVEPRLSTLELIELYEEALHHLKKLLEKYDRAPLTLEEWVEKWVDEYSPQTPNREAYVNYALYLTRNDLGKRNTTLIRELEEEFGLLALEETRMSNFIRDFRSDYNSLKN